MPPLACAQVGLGEHKLPSGCGDPSCFDPAPVADLDRVATLMQCDGEVVELRDNEYYSPHGNASFRCPGGEGDLSLSEIQQRGLEAGSIAGPLPAVDVVVGWATDLLRPSGE